MTTSDFTITLESNRTPAEVFRAITDVRSWWSGYYGETFEGNSKKRGDEFAFRAGDGAHYSKQKLVEVIPDLRMVWKITDSHLSFLDKTDEWTGTKVIFNIENQGDKVLLTFTHEGLTSRSECYESCAPAWTQYLINRLYPIINSGK